MLDISNVPTSKNWLKTQLLKELKGPTSKAAFIARYTGGVDHEDRKKDEISRLEFWGHQLPIHRALAKKYQALTADLVAQGKITRQQEWKLWLTTWKTTNNYDVRSIVLMWFGSRKQLDLRRRYWKDLFAIVKDVDNWALSDGLSSMLAALLEENPQLFIHYQKWNRSKNPWIRRQSLVGIYLYAPMRKKHYPPEKTLKLIERLLDDPHFYVQKAVGWTLREVDRIQPALQKKFVQKNLHRISSTAWYATSELYPLSLKKKLVQERKLHRGQNSKAKSS